MTILKSNKKNNVLQKTNLIENSKTSKQENVEPRISVLQDNSKLKDSQQKVKAAQYYKKIDPAFLSMLNAQAPKRFVALFRKALMLSINDINPKNKKSKPDKDNK